MPGPESRSFRFTYRTTVTAKMSEEGAVDLWIPIAQSDELQTIGQVEITSPIEYKVNVEQTFGNKMLYAKIPERSGDVTIVTSYDVRRLRKKVPTPGPGEYTAEEKDRLARWLTADKKVPLDGIIGEEAMKIADPNEDLPVVRAQKIMDHLMKELAYDKAGCTPERADQLGNLQMACDLKKGTCTEFHGLFVGYARVLGMPARFNFGFNVPLKAEGTIAGYHCWSEVYLPKCGWFPVDVTEEIKLRARDDADEEHGFFFGGLNASRVQLSHGRDVWLVPGQMTGPVDKLIFAHTEVNDEPGELPDLSWKFGPPSGS
jgi:transglutaminase-like putative cysteine protease